MALISASLIRVRAGAGRAASWCLAFSASVSAIHPATVAVHVDEHLVLALPVPHLIAGVARVGEDRADGDLAPRDAAAVPAAGGVVR
ncbi:MAG TPA: hypothetical protein VKV80_04635 [Streptosporangiaceae bacterium]|nr:hypothetical protein [Streptosporangiaceae bacterium]